MDEVIVLVHREMEKWQPCYSLQTGGLNHAKAEASKGS